MPVARNWAALAEIVPLSKASISKVPRQVSPSDASNPRFNRTDCTCVSAPGNGRRTGLPSLAAILPFRSKRRGKLSGARTASPSSISASAVRDKSFNTVPPPSVPKALNFKATVSPKKGRSSGAKRGAMSPPTSAEIPNVSSTAKLETCPVSLSSPSLASRISAT